MLGYRGWDVLETRFDCGFERSVFVHVTLESRLLKISELPRLVQTEFSVDICDFLWFDRRAQTSNTYLGIWIFNRWNALVGLAPSCSSLQPPGPLFSIHFVLLRAQLIDLQRAHEKDDSRIVEEKRPVRVVVSLKLYYVFVARVLLVHLL